MPKYSCGFLPADYGTRYFTVAFAKPYINIQATEEYMTYHLTSRTRALGTDSTIWSMLWGLICPRAEDSNVRQTFGIIFKKKRFVD